MPRSRSLSTNTGVWNRSARSNASIAIVKHSSIEPGSSRMCRVSPCDRPAGERDVLLRGARRQAGGRADALDVEDHRGNLGEVGQAGELGHQRDAGAGGRGHRARARPAGADHHADRRELVLGLHDREGGLARLRVDAVLAQVVDQRLAERRRRRDRIPGDDGDAGQQAAERGGGVAVDQDLAGGLVHPLDAERVRLRRGWPAAQAKPASSAPMFSCQRLGLLAELLGERLLHLVQLDVEQVREDAVVDHVADEPAQLGVGADLGDDLVERHRIEVDVAAQRVQLQRLVVDDDGAGLERQHVLARRLGVHRDQEVDFLLARDVAVLVGADGEPGRQARDVRREEVLAGDGMPIWKMDAQQHEVGGLAARAVDRGDLDAEVVDDRRCGVAQRGSDRPRRLKMP